MTQSQVHILVVDAKRNIRDNLAMVIEAKGYKVDTASNGDDAILRVKEGRYISASSMYKCPKWMTSKHSAIWSRGLSGEALRSQHYSTVCEEIMRRQKSRDEWNRR